MATSRTRAARATHLPQPLQPHAAGIAVARPKLRPVAIAVQCALALGFASMLGVAALPQAAHAQAQGQTASGVRSIQIAAGPLAQVLNTFARSAGVELTVDDALLQGKPSGGLKGNYTTAGGFAVLLQGTGLEAVRQGNGSYAVQQSQELPEVTVTAALQATASSTSTSTDTLPEVVVTASPVGSDSYATQGTTVGTGRMAMKPREVPRSVSAMTEAQMDDQNLNTLEDVMMNMTGVTTARGQGPSALSDVYYIRGYAVDSLQIDGAEAINLDSSQSASTARWTVPDIAMYEQVEVLRGPDGLFTGSGSQGGTINLVRKRALRDTSYGFNVSAGSWQSYRAEVDINQPLNSSGSIRSRVIALAEDSDHWSYLNNSHTKKMIYGVLELDVTDRGVLSLGASVEKRRERAPYLGTYLWSTADAVNGGQNVGSYRLGGTREERHQYDDKQFFGKFEYSFNDDWNLKSNFSYTDYSALLDEYSVSMNSQKTLSGSECVETTDDMQVMGVGCGSVGGVWQQTTSSKINGYDTTLSGKFSLFGRQHDVMTGINFKKYTGYAIGRRYLNSRINVSLDDLLAGNYSISGEIDPDQINNPWWDYRYNNSKWGYFSTLRFHLADPLKLIVGGRWSRSKYWSQSGVTTNYNNAFTPYYALTYDLLDQWTAYASFSEMYAPTVSGVWVGTPDNISKDYTPTTGENWEIGVKGELMGGKLQTAATVFYMPKKNVWVSDSDTGKIWLPDGSEGYLSIPIANQTSKGLDLEAKGQLTPWLQASAGYTYNKTWNSTTQKAFRTYLPEHLLRTWATAKIPNTAWTIGGGVNWQSDTDLQGSYPLVNLMASYQINKHLKASASISNVLDRRYMLINETYWRMYGDPRKVTISLRGQF